MKPLSQMADDLLRRLDNKIAETGNRNYAIARIKLSDALIYLGRGERNEETDKGQEQGA